MKDNDPRIARRGFVAGSGVALLSGFFRPRSAQAQGGADTDWSAIEAANVDVVARFCAAWATRDLSQVTALMADNSVYRMTETAAPVRGHAELIEQMQPWVDTSYDIEFDILDTYAKGPMVIDHRIDYWRSETRPITWEGVGVFYLTDGKIVEWSDYTISVVRG